MNVEPNHQAINFNTDNHIPPINNMNEANPNALVPPYLDEAKNITIEKLINANPQNNPPVTCEAQSAKQYTNPLQSLITSSGKGNAIMLYPPTF